MGRPSKYGERLAGEICERLANGESLREICADAAMPNRETVRRWLRDDETFRKRYARARADQADYFADEILDIAHDGRNDWERRENARTGVESIALNNEAIMRSRLRVETLKWLMAKLQPKKYGEKVEHEVSGNSDIKVTIGGSAP